MPEPFLQVDERNKLITVLAGLYEFTDEGARGRRVLLQETAGLGRFVSSLNLNGSSGIVSGDVVGKLERFGELPERPAYHSLGALLCALLDLRELNHDDAVFVAGIILRYSLIADSAFLQKLRAEYGITEPAERPPAPAALAPAPGVPGASGGPAFGPQIGDQEGLERILGSEDNFLDIHLLRGALYCAWAVGRIERPEGEARGTGFLIGPDLLLTNQHVLKEMAHLEQAVVRFGYQNDTAGVAEKGRVVPIREDFYFASPAEQLDYALVRLAEKPLAAIMVKDDEASQSMAELLGRGKHRGYLIATSRLLISDERVNIIQHPDGNPLKVVLTQNRIVHVTDTRVQYVADTMDGSSGSPVFSRGWEVVALHHSGTPYPPEALGEQVKKVWKGRFRVNEGIPMRVILEDFRARGIEKYLPRA
jgi:V8-like Glu-specific endopeptidase